jgi:amino acid adenylation domain-containing protein
MNEVAESGGFTGFEIAVIGMDGRFPGANSIEGFWENLKNGVESVSFFSEEELEEEGFEREAMQVLNFVRARAIMEEAEHFDATFFGYTPKEAEIMDPQYRAFHQCVWSALENAAYDPFTYKGLIGLYGGHSTNLYWMVKALLKSDSTSEQLGAVTLNGSDALCMRISYKLNLRGPAVSVQTACSTSLVAIHLACQALISGECDIALAGGVSIVLPQKTGYFYQEGMIYSPDGHNRTFDALARGTLGGDGVGVVVLKRLEEAIEEGDQILAIVKGSAVNNDGSRKVGFTASSVEGQSAVIRDAHRVARIEPESIGYIEAHGTATTLGDPIEIEALKKAFNTDKKNFCAVGAVKSNVGHLDAAAGVTGFIKAVLVVEHRLIPPTLHFQIPNPAIDFIKSPFYVNTTLRSFENSKYPLRAGISSFALGGTNAHVVIEEAPKQPESPETEDYHLILLSAKTLGALERCTENLVQFLEENPNVNLADMAFTLKVGRSYFNCRKMMICKERGELINALSSEDHESVFTESVEQSNHKLVFLITLDQEIHPEMGKELYETELAFQQEMDLCIETIRKTTGKDLRSILFPVAGESNSFNSEKSRSLKQQTYINFIFKYSLAKLIINWGVPPDAILGSGLGEVLAACLAGVFSLEKAVQLLNWPLEGTVSEGSHIMGWGEPQAETDDLLLEAPNIPFISNITGTWITMEQARDIRYWRELSNNLRGQTIFNNCINTLVKDPDWCFLEIGTSNKSSLTEQVRQHPEKKPEHLFQDLMNPNWQSVKEIHYLLQQIGKLWLKGIPVEWEQYCSPKKRHRIPLPTYPFEAQAFDISVKELIQNTNRVLEGKPLELEKNKDSEPIEKQENSNNIKEAGQDIEDKLAYIFREVLGVMNINADDDFFALNGDSLKAISLITKIQKVMEVRVSVEEIFKMPTIRELSLYIREAGKIEYESIDPVEKKEYYNLSPGQKRMYVLQKMNEDSTVYNLPEFFFMEEEPDLEQLNYIFSRLIKRHDNFQVCFDLIHGEPKQIMREDAEIQVEYDKWIGGRVEDKDNSQDLEVIQGFIRPFDLSQAPLIRVKLVKINESKYLFMIDIHHIISDGTSHEILVEDFLLMYSGKELAPLKVRYKDYSEWINKEQQVQKMNQSETFWMKEYKDEKPVLNLPMDFPRPIVQSSEGKRIHSFIDQNKTTSLKQLASQFEVTLFMMIIAIYNVFLSKLSGQQDIVVGFPIAGRKHADIEEIIGMFVNTMTIRNYPSETKTFTEFLQEVKQKVLDVFENQDYPFEELVEKVVTDRDTSRNPLFDTMLMFQNIEMVSTENILEDEKMLTLTPVEYKVHSAMFDLTLIVHERDKQFLLEFEYCTRLFRDETIERFISYFHKIVSEVITDPGIGLAEIEIISDQERNQVLYEFNKTRVPYPKEKLLHEWVEFQVEKLPHHISIKGNLIEDEHELDNPGISMVTYSTLNQLADILSMKCQEKKIEPPDIIGVMTGRTIGMIVALLGVMKSGNAYLPIDPGYPTDRIKYVLADSRAGALITTRKCLKSIEDNDESIKKTINNREIIYLEDELLLKIPVKGEESRSLVKRQKAEALAYVIYTSGSTGKPKGVMIGHQSLGNFIQGITDHIPFTTLDTILSLTTISFDIFGLEVLLPLAQGSRVVLGTEEEQVNAEAVAQRIREDKINLLQVTPSRLSLLLENEYSIKALKEISYLLVGGEAFPGSLLEQVHEIFDGKIFNLYGPTETTIWSSIKDVSRGNDLNIGKPIANTRIYILDSYGNMQPPGILGELCIAGHGLARGYINYEEMTDQKFPPDPFQKGERLYRTGDTARWRMDGNLEFVGRMDHQVKIRGFRIELGEIENQLAKHNEVKEVVVCCRENDREEKHICAYIVSNDPFEVGNLRDFLAKKLPSYMIPSYFFRIDEVPLTPNGKLDRKSLYAFEIEYEPKVEYVPPQNETEELIAEIWADVLGVAQVGIYDNFFELGGNSINLIKVHNSIKEITGKTLPVVFMFRYHTIHSLSRFVNQAEPQISYSIERIEESVDMMEESMQLLYGEEND